MFAFVLALVAGMPFHIDVVDVCKMALQMRICFKCLVAHFTRKPFHVDIVLDAMCASKMSCGGVL